MCNFKIGDTVEVIVDQPDGNGFIHNGMTGVVQDIQEDSDRLFGVCFDEYVGGHNLGCGGNTCESGYGWYLTKNEIKKCINTYEFSEEEFRGMIYS